MLKITGSHNERAAWLQSLEINMVLALIRSKDKNGVWNIEYELMQLCTEEQQQQIINKMSTIDKQKYDLYQNKKELGMSNRNFDYFNKAENEVARVLDLPATHEVYN